MNGIDAMIKNLKHNCTLGEEKELLISALNKSKRLQAELENIKYFII